jgi:hypothetical protein
MNADERRKLVGPLGEVERRRSETRGPRFAGAVTDPLR